MGVHEHRAHTKTDRLIAAVEALTDEVRKLSERLLVVPASDPPAVENNIMLLSQGTILRDIRDHGPISQALKSAS